MALLGFNNPEKFNKSLALQRIIKDTSSDFIFAPHINIVFEKAGDELYDLPAYFDRPWLHGVWESLKTATSCVGPCVPTWLILRGWFS